ncbi:MAG: hypothetical protein WBI53_12550 [Paludibacter sp.]
MKRIILLLISFVFIAYNYADNKNTGDPRTSVVKIESSWNKPDNETPSGTNNQTVAIDGITFSSTSEGIYIMLPKATSNVKLFALTGEVVWSGNLVQGRFFIPTRQGIYFLRINNKSYKVICK